MKRILVCAGGVRTGKNERLPIKNGGESKENVKSKPVKGGVRARETVPKVLGIEGSM